MDAFRKKDIIIKFPLKIEFKCEECENEGRIMDGDLYTTIHIKELIDIVQAIQDGWPICEICGNEMVEI